MQGRRFLASSALNLVRYLTFIVAVKLSEGAEPIQPPTCSFQVDGLKQTCSKFEAGCNISDPQLEKLEDLEYVEFSMNEDDYLNITFEINLNDGMLVLYSTNDCWIFQLNDNFTANNGSDVQIYFNFIPNYYLLHPGAIYYIDYGCPLLDVKLEGKLHSESREFALQIYDPEKIETAEVTLLGSKCYIKCSGIGNSCEVDILDTIQLSEVNQEIVFSNLTYGYYYCARVETSSNCPAIYTKTSQLKPVVSTVKPKAILLPLSIGGILILVLVTLAVTISAMVIIAFKERQGDEEEAGEAAADVDPQEEEIIDWISKMNEWRSMPPSPTVLLLYSRDSVEFCTVMEALIVLLETCANIKILDPFADSQSEDVYRNISGWVMKHLRTGNVKIIVVESEGSYIRQQALLSKKHSVIMDSNCIDSVLGFALSMLHTDYSLRENYVRLFRIRFESITRHQVTLKYITPMKHYCLVPHLNKLIMGLKDCSFTPTNRLTMRDIRQQFPDELDDLEYSIYCMENMLKRNSHHIQLNLMFSSK